MNNLNQENSLQKKNLTIEPYQESCEKDWDEFVETLSVNGTFLQTRRFLNYHPEGRFTDASYLVRDEKGVIVAVCPACANVDDTGKKTLYSHGGSTYGGILISEKWYKTNKVLTILQSLEDRWKQDGFQRIILKQTPTLLAAKSQDLLEYCFYYLGYASHKELNLYVDFDGYSEDILSELTKMKRRNVNHCVQAGCVCRKLITAQEIGRFWDILALNLEKYEKTPVHTAAELYDFVNSRLKNECEIFGIYTEEKMTAGSMMFYFNRSKVAHTQYLCADPAYNKLSPMSYTYYAMLCEMRKRGFDKVSWGIVTEDMGRYLNIGLVESKEAYGSKHAVNLTYEKDFGFDFPDCI